MTAYAVDCHSCSKVIELIATLAKHSSICLKRKCEIVSGIQLTFSQNC